MATSLETGANSGPGMNEEIGSGLAPQVRPAPQSVRPYQRLANDDRGTGGQSTADFLGYFSLALGLAEAIAPSAMARLIGVAEPDDRSRMAMRLMGLREIGHGLSVLSKQDAAPALWARVGGDALDLAFLGRTFANPKNSRGRTAFATANVLAVAALDYMTARELSRQPDSIAKEKMEQGIIRTKRSATVRAPVEQVYAVWRDFSNFPRFMRHLDYVDIIDERRSHWVAKGPAGTHAEWDAVITDDRPNELIAWRSLEGSEVGNRGMVAFRPAPGDRGTEVRVWLEYDPPFGKLGSKVAMLWREEPGQQVQDALKAFKELMETGEVLVSDATKEKGMHPAHP